MKVILETRRLFLREMRLQDLDFIASMLSDAEVMRFYPKNYSREESQAWIQRQIDRYQKVGHSLWLVLDKASGQPVGQVGLLPQQIDGSREAEIGYLIHRPFWRMGFATEAATGVRDFAFRTFAKQRVISLIRPENIPSLGVASKLGMAAERTIAHAGLEHLLFVVRSTAAPGPSRH